MAERTSREKGIQHRVGFSQGHTIRMENIQKRKFRPKGTYPPAYAILQAAFEGKLKVEDTTAFKDALVNGIGREKAYGMGLLTIAGREA